MSYDNRPIPLRVTETLLPPRVDRPRVDLVSVAFPPDVARAPEMARPRLAGRIPELDGLRGLAIALVLIDHYLVELTPPKYGLLFHLAWSGVDLFFVLSGFLIAGILLDAQHSPSYFKTFYSRRFNRIIPLYAIWLGIFAVGACSIGPSTPAPLKGAFGGPLPLWTYFLFLQNFAMCVKNNYGALWMGMTWSLAVEEQFYMLLPLVIRRLSHKTLCRIVLFTIVAVPIFRIYLQLLDTDKVVMYTLLPCRADALGLGVLVALAYRNQAIWTWLCSHRRYIYAAFWMLGVGVAMWTLREFPFMERIGFTWMGAFYTCLLLLVLAKPGPLERLIFGRSPLVKLGIIAYGVYLLHNGILALCHYLFLRESPGIHDAASALVTILSLCVTLGLAAISWRYLEKPLIRRAHARYSYEAS
jgi:peptidoglycan/LPS O-acetylase OafA/YrhL